MTLLRHVLFGSSLLVLADRPAGAQQTVSNEFFEAKIRPILAETRRYGEYSKPGEFVYDRPFQWGSRRIGPDLHRIGGKYPYLWHVRHMQDPRSTTPQSIMPAYGWLFKDNADFASIQKRVDGMAMLGVPYGEAVLHAESMARKQAHEVSLEIVAQGGPSDLEGKEIIALIAYLQRLGTDIKKLPNAASAPDLKAESETPARTGSVAVNKPVLGGI